MKQSPFPFIGIVPASVCFLQLLLLGSVLFLLCTAAEEDRRQQVSVDVHKAVGLECLATTADLDSFHCVKAKAPMGVPYRCIDAFKGTQREDTRFSRATLTLHDHVPLANNRHNAALLDG